MKLRLDDSVASPQDLRAMILEIRGYARWFSHNAVRKRAGAKHGRTAEAPELSLAAAALIKALGARQPVSTQRLDGLIAGLEDYADDAPVLSITLAAPPAGSLKKQLVAWCRENIAPDALVNFSFNSTLLGGMVVRSGSHIFDWSFRRSILEGRQKFPEVLRNVR
jgi:hypothetical protein